MKKAMRQAAGTAVLGVALAAAAVTPAAADALGGGLGGGLGALPTGGLPTVNGLPTGSVHDLTTGPVSDGQQALSSKTGSVHAVTGTAQGLVNTAAPSVQSVSRSLPSLPAAPSGTGNPNTLPVVGQVPAVSSLPGVGQLSGATSGGLGKATSSLPVHTPLG